MRVNRWLAAIVAAHFLIGLLYIWATPMFEAPDEGYHVAAIRWMAQGRGLPLQVRGPDGRFIREPYEQEGSQPPLYYLIGAGLTFWLDTADWDQVFVRNPFTRNGYAGTTHNVNLYRPAPPEAEGATWRFVMALRLYSLALSCATIVFAFWLARLIFGEEPAARAPVLLATALVALNPKALFINASVNNDNLLMVLSTATLWAVVAVSRSPRRPTALQLTGLGVLLGLAALTKVSGLVLWPVAALGVIWQRWKADGGQLKSTDGLSFFPQPSSSLYSLALIFTVALLICGWWFARNLLLYGELLGLDTMVAVIGPRVPPISLFDLLAQEWYGFYLSYWSVFGVFTILASDWAHAFFHALTVAALLGLGVTLGRRRGRVSFPVLLLVLFCTLTLAGVVRWTMQTPASQGRLLFGAIAPLSMGVAAGLLAFLPQPFPLREGRGVRASHAALAIGTALAVAAALIPVLDIAPQYAPPPVVAESDLPPDFRPVRAVLGDGLELVGYTTNDAPRQPGEQQPVTLYWRALQALPRDDALALVLFGRDNTGVGVIDTWPGRGLLPPTQMQPGVLYADTIPLPIAAEAITPSVLRLRVGLWRAGPENRLPIRLPDGAQTDTLTLQVGRLSTANHPPPAPAVADGSTFESGVELVGYTARVAGNELALTLNWRTRERVPADYTLFVHLIDSAGVQVAQADGPPLNGDWPTSAWLPDEAFGEARRLTWPANATPGCCSVRLGWYDAATGSRLAAFQPGGEPWPDNAVVLTVIK